MGEWRGSRQGEGAEEASTRTLIVPVCTAYALNSVLLSLNFTASPSGRGHHPCPLPMELRLGETNLLPKRAQLSGKPNWNPVKTSQEWTMRLEPWKPVSTVTPGPASHVPRHAQAKEWSLSSSSFPPMCSSPMWGREVGNVCQVGSICQLCHQGAKSKAGKGGAVRSQEEQPMAFMSEGTQGCRAEGDRKGGSDGRQVGSPDVGSIQPSSQQAGEQAKARGHPSKTHARNHGILLDSFFTLLLHPPPPTSHL